MQVNAASNACFQGVFQRKSDEKYNYYQMTAISFTQHKAKAIESQLLYMVARRSLTIFCFRSSQTGQRFVCNKYWRVTGNCPKIIIKSRHKGIFYSRPRIFRCSRSKELKPKAREPSRVVNRKPQEEAGGVAEQRIMKIINFRS
jgi:hypothetical protein